MNRFEGKKVLRGGGAGALKVEQIADILGTDVKYDKKKREIIGFSKWRVHETPIQYVIDVVATYHSDETSGLGVLVHIRGRLYGFIWIEMDEQTFALISADKLGYKPVKTKHPIVKNDLKATLQGLAPAMVKLYGKSTEEEDWISYELPKSVSDLDGGETWVFN